MALLLRLPVNHKLVPFSHNARHATVGQPSALAFNLTEWLCSELPTTTTSFPIRILFVGDSQTRYLFSQLAMSLFETRSCWWSVNPVLPPRPHSPRTRLAFSWVTQQWPPQWFIDQIGGVHGSNSTAPPYVLGYLAVEYASSERWILNFARRFDPTHVVVGRGCWDMIRRLPLPDNKRIAVMCNEYKSLIAALVTSQPRAGGQKLRTVFLFPALSIAYARFFGAFTKDEQRRRNPWTSCLIEKFQHFFHEGLRLCAFAIQQEAEALQTNTSIVLMEAYNETQYEDFQATDGIHYDSYPVLQKLFWTFANGLAAHRMVSFSSRAANHALPDGVAHIDAAFDNALSKDNRCRHALASYTNAMRTHLIPRIIHETIPPPSDWLSTSVHQNTSVSAVCTTEESLRCAHLRYGLWRYLGPWPWPAPSVVPSEVTVLCNRCFESIGADKLLRSSVVRALRMQRHLGSGMWCKAAVMFLSDIESNASEENEVQLFHNDIRCLNEPFGGRP